MTKDTAPFIGIIEEPSPFNTLQTWERYLAKVQAMDIHPDNAPSKAHLLRSAHEMIAEMKKEAKRA